MRRLLMYSIISAGLVTVTGCEQAQSQQSKVNVYVPVACEELSSEIRRELEPNEMIVRSETELKAIYNYRTCIKTYPFPKGISLSDDEDNVAITSKQMLALKKRVESLIYDYNRLGTIGIQRHFNGEDDYTFLRFYGAVDDGADLVLMKKYGHFLYILVLMREGDLEEAQTQLDKVFKKWPITAQDEKWDEADHLTYFSKSTLDNLFLRFKYDLSAKQGEQTLNNANKMAAEFSKIRSLLSDELEFLGDPGEDLLFNAGCN